MNLQMAASVCARISENNSEYIKYHLHMLLYIFSISQIDVH